MEYIAIENWSGGTGKLLVTKSKVKIKKGDNYISNGFSGENVFSWQGENEHIATKVIAITPDLVWCWSGNNRLSELPKLEF